MVDDLMDCLFPYIPAADERMPVLMTFSDIHAVIDMKCFQVLQTDQMIEMLEYLIQVIHNVIPGIPHMAGVHTKPYLVF